MVGLAVVDWRRGVVACEHFSNGKCQGKKPCWVQEVDLYTTVFSGKPANNSNPTDKNTSGWNPFNGEQGTFTGKTLVDTTTKDFSEFAEASRARWDFAEFLKVKIRQLLHKKP